MNSMTTGTTRFIQPKPRGFDHLFRSKSLASTPRLPEIEEVNVREIGEPRCEPEAVTLFEDKPLAHELREHRP